MTAHAYAVVVAPIANLRAHPDHRSELTSQRWHGEVVELEARRGLWLRVAGWDGYPGWVRFSSLAGLGSRAARSWERAASTRAWGHALVVRESGSSRAPVLAVLPWGSRLESLGWDGSRKFTRVRLADGRDGAVRSSGLMAVEDRMEPREAGRRAAALALAVRGVPYLWGGTTSWGFDCSGLVQWAFALTGRALPRDACDQMHRSRPLGPHEPAEPGDLLFFGRGGRARHVALLTRPPAFVHAYGRVEEGTLASGPHARPELRPVCLGLHRVGQ